MSDQIENNVTEITTVNTTTDDITTKNVITTIDTTIKESTPDKLGKLDLIVSKIISRKFLVWTVCLMLLIFGKILSEEFVYICGIFIGMEGVQNLVEILKARKQ